MIKYTTNKVSPSWDSIDAIWHVFLMLAEPTHKVTVYLVSALPPADPLFQKYALDLQRLRSLRIGSCSLIILNSRDSLSNRASLLKGQTYVLT